MKQILLKTWLMLVCLLVIGGGKAWAETYTIRFLTNSSDGTTTIAANTQVSTVVSAGASYVSGFTSTCSKAYYKSINGVKLGTKDAAGTLEFNIATNYQSNIKSITVKSVKFGSDTGTLTLYSGSTSLKTGITPGTDYTHTFTTATTVSSIKLSTSAKRAYISEIVLETGGGGGTTNYTVTVANNIANGTVTADPTSATAGATVTLTANPNTGYEFGSWNVTDASSNSITVTNNKFTMPASNVNVSATFNAIQGGGDEPSGDGTTYNFADMTDFSSWDTGYEKKTTTFSDGAYAELASANKSNQTITDCPVTKGDDVIFKAPSGKKIASLTFTCTQWTTKAQTITLNTSSNGTDYTATSTTSSNFVLSASNLTDVTAVKFTFSSTSNQVGIKSIKVTYEETGDPDKTAPTLSFANPTYNATMGEAFVAPTLTNEQNVTVSYTSSATGVATVNATTGAISLVAPGTTKITASFAGDETYKAAEASYQLVVAAAPAPKYAISYAATDNGTIVVKNGETVLAEGAEVAAGTKLTIVCTPTDAENYKFKNWQYKVGEGSWTTKYSNNQEFDMPDGNTQFRANFELIPVYTVAFSVNGNTIKSDDLKEGTAVTVPADPEAINGKVFTGWIETATVEGETPAYVTPAATATKTVTYYAVFATQTGSGSGNATSISAYADGKYILVDVYDNKYYAMNDEVSSKKISATEITSAVTTNQDGSISIDLTNAVIANIMKYDITHENSEYVIKYGENKIYLQAKGNDLTTSATTGSNPVLNNFVWTGFEEGSDNKAGRFSITTKGTNGSGNATDNCLLMQASNWNGSTQNPTLIFKGYVQNNRGSVTEKAQCYASGYMWFVPAVGGATYSDYTTFVGYTRSVTSDNFGTICLPCATSSVEGATIYNVAGVKKAEDEITGIVLEEVEGNLEAGKPYIFKATASTLTATYTGTSANEAANATGLVGNLTSNKITVEATGYNYVIGGDNKIHKVVTGGSGVTIGANRAYLNLEGVGVYTPAGSNRAIFFGFDGTVKDEWGTPTSIEDVETTTNNTIYNLQGQRVNRLQQGVNIVNGRKVIR